MDYNTKKKINEKISLIENKNILKEIFKIAKDDLEINGKKKYSINNNGIYFDLLLISDDKLLEIKKIVFDYFSETDSEINQVENSIYYNKYSQDNKVELIHGNNNGPKLSNQEKSILLKNISK